MEVHIPKIIMQTWKNNILPDEWKVSQTSIYKYMSSWKYILLNDDDNRNFIIKHFPDFLSYYDKFPYNIQSADAIRYCWLYINGGLYIDCDYEFLVFSLEIPNNPKNCLAPLDDLFITQCRY
jgi:mannosyltransferase OCH1-like enzyme